MSLNEIKPKAILKLDQGVINKICAGEVIHRPLNVVKELIENSLDAGATNIIVTLKNGGMKSITIQDNGCGIKKEDLEIVCNRFTTSKLNNFNDLQSLSTFGFRGEALSSVSTVSHLTITTKTANNVCGYKAEYIDGILKANSSIIPVASNNGTTIVAENLFYNIPTRKSALSSESTEFALVQDLITRYSILHSQKCCFILKKFGENTHVVNTNITNSILNNINNLYAQSISSHLISFKSANDKFCFKSEGFVSNGDLNLKKFHFLLFINSRIVECSSLKKSIKDLYKNYIMKGGHPFVLLILQIDPRNIDVNVHPTKSEVCFLYQSEIFNIIIKCIEEKLRSKNINQIPSQLSSQKEKNESIIDNLKRQSITNSFSKKQEIDIEPEIDFEPNSEKKKSTHVKPRSNSESKCQQSKPNRQSFTAPKPYRQVRTDSRLQRIDQYIHQKQNDPKKRRRMNLESLLYLRNEVFKSYDQSLFDILNKSTYVGCIDENFVLIQNNLDLLMINIRNLNEELFYQIYLIDFGNFDYIQFQKPLPLFSLLSTYFEVNAPNTENMKKRIQDMIGELVSNSTMLNDYFSLKIDTKNATIEAFPCLIEGHLPVMTYLPDFIYRLVSNVNWEEEKQCFRSFGTELARFYSRTPPKLSSEEHYMTWAGQIENTLYPLYKSLLFPSSNLTDIHTFHTVANINSLYKVFERC